MIKELKIKSGHELRYAPFKVDTYKVKLWKEHITFLTFLLLYRLLLLIFKQETCKDKDILYLNISGYN